jgi:2-hydroxy-3-keto-5-methylthiopentenyl-1-phosphate phosphatase
MLPLRYPRSVVPVASVLVDFDGTACLHDVAADLLDEFGEAGWSAYDAAWERGELGGREVLDRQAVMLRAPLEELVAFALGHCPIDPTFGPFVDWSRSAGLPVTLVSDGFGFYIEPLLAAHGIHGVVVRTNEWRGDATARLRYGNGHPVCVGCGTCKKLLVEQERASTGAVAFVGEGPSDRFGARYADVTFAKVGESLIRRCEEGGIPFVPWTTFDDVRSWLEGPDPLPGALGGEPCPGWRDPA